MAGDDTDNLFGLYNEDITDPHNQLLSLPWANDQQEFPEERTNQLFNPADGSHDHALGVETGTATTKNCDFSSFLHHDPQNPQFVHPSILDSPDPEPNMENDNIRQTDQALSIPNTPQSIRSNATSLPYRPSPRRSNLNLPLPHSRFSNNNSLGMNAEASVICNVSQHVVSQGTPAVRQNTSYSSGGAGIRHDAHYAATSQVDSHAVNSILPTTGAEAGVNVARSTHMQQQPAAPSFNFNQRYLPQNHALTADSVNQMMETQHQPHRNLLNRGTTPHVMDSNTCPGRRFDNRFHSYGAGIDSSNQPQCLPEYPGQHPPRNSSMLNVQNLKRQLDPMDPEDCELNELLERHERKRRRCHGSQPRPDPSTPTASRSPAFPVWQNSFSPFPRGPESMLPFPTSPKPSPSVHVGLNLVPGARDGANHTGLSATPGLLPGSSRVVDNHIDSNAGQDRPRLRQVSQGRWNVLRLFNQFEDVQAAIRFIEQPNRDIDQRPQIAEDDWQTVKLEAGDFALKLYANLQKPPNLKPATLKADDLKYYQNRQRSAYQSCLACFADEEGKKFACARCVVVIDAIVRYHEEGPPRYTGGRGEETKRRGYTPQKMFKCSERMRLILKGAKDSKYVANDILSGTTIWDLVISPEQYMARKLTNSRANGKRSTNKAAATVVKPGDQPIKGEGAKKATKGSKKVTKVATPPSVEEREEEEEEEEEGKEEDQDEDEKSEVEDEEEERPQEDSESDASGDSDVEESAEEAANSNNRRRSRFIKSGGAAPSTKTRSSKAKKKTSPRSPKGKSFRVEKRVDRSRDARKKR